MTQIFEHKVLEVLLDDKSIWKVKLADNPKEATVEIAGVTIKISSLKGLIDAFTDRYPFAFAEEIASDATDNPSEEDKP